MKGLAGYYVRKANATTLPYKEIIKETKKAYLIRFINKHNNTTLDVWLPKSQIDLMKHLKLVDIQNFALKNFNKALTQP